MTNLLNTMITTSILMMTLATPLSSSSLTNIAIDTKKLKTTEQVSTMKLLVENVSSEVMIKVEKGEVIETFRLLDFSKELLYEVSYESASSQISLDLSGIPTGKYFLSVKTKNGLEFFKPVHKD